MKKILILSLISLLILLFSAQITFAEGENLILEQPDSELIIQNYEGEYEDGESRWRSEGAMHSVDIKNRSEQDIVAYSITFMCFDVFNRTLGRPLDGYAIETIESGKEINSRWNQRLSQAGLFKKYGTSIAYVSRIRFEDGTIWEYDSNIILEQVQEIEESLTVEDISAEQGDN